MPETTTEQSQGGLHGYNVNNRKTGAQLIQEYRELFSTLKNAKSDQSSTRCVTNLPFCPTMSCIRKPAKTVAERCRDYRARVRHLLEKAGTNCTDSLDLLKQRNCGQKKPKTGAERARQYRERKKARESAALQKVDTVKVSTTYPSNSTTDDSQTNENEPREHLTRKKTKEIAAMENMRFGNTGKEMIRRESSDDTVFNSTTDDFQTNLDQALNAEELFNDENVSGLKNTSLNCEEPMKAPRKSTNSAEDQSRMEGTCSNDSRKVLSNEQLKELLNVVHKHEVLYDMSHVRHFDDTHISNVWDEIGQQTGYGAQQCRLSWHDVYNKFLIFYNRVTLVTGEKHELHEEMMRFPPSMIYKNLTTMEVEEAVIQEMKMQEAGNNPNGEPYVTLINCIYQYRELYDTNHPMYHVESYTLQIWRQIRKQLPCLVSGSFCKKLWELTRKMFLTFYIHVTLVTGEKHVLHDLLVRFVPFLLKVLQRKANISNPHIGTQKNGVEVNMIQNDIENNSIINDSDTDTAPSPDLQEALDNSVCPEEFVKTETSIAFPDEIEIKKEDLAWETNSEVSHAVNDDYVNDVKYEIITMEPTVSTISAYNSTTDDYQTNEEKLDKPVKKRAYTKRQESNRKSPKTGAERSRAYRERIKARQCRAVELERQHQLSTDAATNYLFGNVLFVLPKVPPQLITVELPAEHACKSQQQASPLGSTFGSEIDRSTTDEQHSPTCRNSAPTMNRRKSSAERTRQYRARKKLAEQNQLATYVHQLITVESLEKLGQERTDRLQSLDVAIEQQSSAETSDNIRYATEEIRGNIDSSEFDNQQLRELLDVVYKHEVLYDWSHEHHFDDTHISYAWDEIGRQTGYGAQQCRLNWHSFCKKFLTFYNNKTLITGENHDLHDKMVPFLPLIYKDISTMKLEQDLIEEIKTKEVGKTPCTEPYITLINCIYQYRELYDMNHPRHSDNQYTLIIWRQIRKQVPWLGTSSVNSCKMMWEVTHKMFLNFYIHVTLVTGEKHVLHDSLVRFVPFFAKHLERIRNNTKPHTATENNDEEVNIIQNGQNYIERIGINSIINDSDTDRTSKSTTNDFQTFVYFDELVKTETNIVFPEELEIKKENITCETNSELSHTVKDEYVNDERNENISCLYNSNTHQPLNIEKFGKSVRKPSKPGYVRTRDYRARRKALELAAQKQASLRDRTIGSVIARSTTDEQHSPTCRNSTPSMNKRKSSAERTRQYRARKKLAEQNQLATDSPQLITVESPEKLGQERTGRLQTLNVAIEQQSPVETPENIYHATEATCSNLRLWELDNQQLKVLLDVVYRHEVLYDWSHVRYFDDKHVSNVWGVIGKQTGYGAKRCRLNWQITCKRFLTFYNKRTLISGEKYDLHEEMVPFIPYIYKDLTAMQIEEDLIAENKIQEAGNTPRGEPYITLINSIYQHRELYDENHPMYNDANHTLNIWKQIGEQINCTVGSCKAKWMKTQSKFFKFYTNVTVVTGKKHVLHDLLVRFVTYLPKFRNFRKNTHPQHTNMLEDNSIFIDTDTDLDEDENVNNEPSIPTTFSSNPVTDNFQRYLDNYLDNKEFVENETSMDIPHVMERNQENLFLDTRSEVSYTEEDQNVNGVKNEIISIEPSFSTISRSSFTTVNCQTNQDRSSILNELVKTETSITLPNVIAIKNEKLDEDEV